jgi:glycerol-3-phosphate dehydrogenase
LNYCTLDAADYSPKDRQWTIHLSDVIGAGQCSGKARIILNCAGVWTDSVNRRFNIQSPYRHVMSKGVFIGYQRPEAHQTPIIFEMGEHGDTLTFIPWGPVSLWGPTETMEESIENGFSINPEDIHFLQHHAAKNLEPSLAGSRIISLRCGIRPLAVSRTFKADCYPLDISRYHKTAQDLDRPWISVYGGKISSCVSMAEKIGQKIAGQIAPRLQGRPWQTVREYQINRESFPGLQADFPAIDWCVANEFCCTLEDYLRRRTNISQWLPREGLGFENENRAHLENLARRLPAFTGISAEKHVEEYITGVTDRFDRLMAKI